MGIANNVMAKKCKNASLSAKSIVRKCDEERKIKMKAAVLLKLINRNLKYPIRFGGFVVVVIFDQKS